MADINRLQQLLARLEKVRTRLEEALDAASGNHQDPTVQRIADEFDELLNEYNREKYGKR